MVEVMITLPDLPDGWEYTGAYRIPQNGEPFASRRGAVYKHKESTFARHIVRQARWVPTDGDRVWFLDGDGSPVAALFNRDVPWHNSAVSNSMVFKTEDIAKRAAQAIVDLCITFDFNKADG